MKIIFNLHNVGLGNNGGTYTLVQSMNILCKLGHDVYLLDDCECKYTWDKISAIPIKTCSEIPQDADCIFATGYRSVDDTLKINLDCLKVHWIRGWETWNMPENMIVDKIVKSPLVKFVNSIGLYEKLHNYNEQSHIVYPGTDPDIYSNSKLRIFFKFQNTITLGALYNHGSKRSGKRTQWVFEIYQKLKLKFPDKKIQLFMYGCEGRPKEPDIFMYDPLNSLKNDLYNLCDMWLSPSENEGLHIPPIEAMLSGCPVITTNCQMSGTRDYVVDGKNGFVTENNQESMIAACVKLIENEELRYYMSENCRKSILDKIGTRYDQMTKMVSLLEKLINGN